MSGRVPAQQSPSPSGATVTARDHTEDLQMFTPAQRRRRGDVDNRVKTLIDGLTVPLPGVPAEAEDDAFNRLCLLEDDPRVLRSPRRPWSWSA